LVGIKAMEDWIKANGGKRPSRTDISNSVRNIKNFKGVTGAIQFNNMGDSLKAKYFVLQYAKPVYPGKVIKVIEQQAPAAAKKP
jgi:ABC-type branched-subunit amino acid transport system substrate-binding protein